MKKYKLGIVAAAIGLCSIGNVFAEEQKPMKSWLHAFTHSGQWQGKPHADIFGVLQPTFTHTEDTAIEDNFHFTRARAGVRGAVHEDVSYWMLAEFADNGVTRPVDGAVRLLDAQLNWRFMDNMNLRMGLFIPDFGQGITPGALVPWIDYTDIEKTVWFFNRQGDTETTALREMGASLWNEYRWDNSAFNYEIGLYNGNGIRQGETADDDKDIIASARYAVGPWWVKSGYWTGERLVSGEKLDKEKMSFSAGWGDYVNGKYWILGEYLETDEDQAGGLSNLESDGYYVAGGFKLPNDDLLVYRYSACDCEENAGPPGVRDSEVHTLTYSHFIKGQMKIVAQYDARSDDLPGASDNDTFKVYFSLPFSHRIF